MLNRKIFALFYKTERALWYRIFLVAGYRKPMRLYFIRIGAGIRFDNIYPTPFVMLIKTNLVFKIVYFGATQLYIF